MHHCIISQALPVCGAGDHSHIQVAMTPVAAPGDQISKVLLQSITKPYRHTHTVTYSHPHPTPPPLSQRAHTIPAIIEDPPDTTTL